jgi:large subunit ribosomal protein L23
MHIYEVIRRPLITEKSTRLQEEKNDYAFEVTGKATKKQIKEAVEKAFKVRVINVNVLNVKGKEKRLGRRLVMTPSLKKAIVTLGQGDKIQYFEGV